MVSKDNGDRSMKKEKGRVASSLFGILKEINQRNIKIILLSRIIFNDNN